MSEAFSIDLGSAIPYLVESVKGWFEKDKESLSAEERFTRIFRLGLDVSSSIRCLGMWQPIPITDIYQQTRLRANPPSLHEKHDATDIWALIDRGESAIIHAGPGDGKTTLMHWTFVQLASPHRQRVPLLIPLRWPGALSDLQGAINALAHGKARREAKRKPLVLLVDGYDEVSKEQRREVSKLLMEYRSLRCGPLYLTCRSHYSVYDLPVATYWIDDFNEADALGFARVFLKAYASDVNAEVMLLAMKRRGFRSFTEHPLLLALVCLLQTSQRVGLPRTPIGLIRRAIDTLTYRWDESKAVSRESALNLDGEERVRSLMHIAFEMDGLVDSYDRIRQIVARYLRLQQIDVGETHQLLQELAQWYGLLVPLSGEEWGFVHRTVRDYLYARHWVESGRFASEEPRTSNTAAAYAMSLMPDATDSLIRALGAGCEIHVLSECFRNGAVFDVRRVAKQFVEYIRIMGGAKWDKTNTGVRVAIPAQMDILEEVTEPFLDALVNALIDAERDETRWVLLGYALYEYLRRAAAMEGPRFGRLRQSLGRVGYSFEVRKGEKWVEFRIEDIARRE